MCVVERERESGEIDRGGEWKGIEREGEMDRVERERGIERRIDRGRKRGRRER